MVDIVPLLKLLPIVVAGMISPGPDFMIVSSIALSRGRMAGVQAACGIAVGILIYVVLCLFGLGAVFSIWPWLMTGMRVLGGLYLIYLAYQLWRSSFVKTSDVGMPISNTARSRKNPFLAALVTNLTNPKAFAFFTSIFALTLPAEPSISTRAAILVLMGLLPLLWFSFVSFGLSMPQARKVYMRWSRWIDRVSGTFLGFFGVRLLLPSRD